MERTSHLPANRFWTRPAVFSAVLYVAVPLAFFLIVFLYFPFRSRFEFDTDEGLQLIKALLYYKGYPLYTQVWSDHPPLFTMLLAACIRWFGYDVNAARTLTLALSACMVGAAYTRLHLEWGWLHGLAGAILICLLPYYLTLSVSVMIGLPSIAFAMLSLLALSLWHRNHNPTWLVISAVAMALSSLTKLFTAFLAPVFLAGIVVDGWLQAGRKRSGIAWLKPALVWGGVYGLAAAGAIIIVASPQQVPQLAGIHLAAREAEVYASSGDAFSIHSYLRALWPILAMALAGTIFAIVRKKWLSLYLAAWCGAAYALLLSHVPVFYHHQLLITIPAAMLAGIAFGEAASLMVASLRSRPAINLRSVSALVMLAVCAAAVIPFWRAAHRSFYLRPEQLEPAVPRNGQEDEFMDEIQSRAAQTEWMVTDLPIFAFRAGLPVPPILAVISRKRMESGELSERRLISIIEEYKPEQVLIGRFELPELENLLQEDYRLVKAWGKKQLYVLDRLTDTP